jgi:hypothetical protein
MNKIPTLKEWLEHPAFYEQDTEMQDLLRTFIGKTAPGAIPCGTKIEKINSGEGDGHDDGDTGTVAGSAEGIGFGYWILWDDLPNGPFVFIAGHRIKVKE